MKHGRTKRLQENLKLQINIELQRVLKVFVIQNLDNLKSSCMGTSGYTSEAIRLAM